MPTISPTREILKRTVACALCAALIGLPPTQAYAVVRAIPAKVSTLNIRVVVPGGVNASGVSLKSPISAGSSLNAALPGAGAVAVHAGPVVSAVAVPVVEAESGYPVVERKASVRPAQTAIQASASKRVKTVIGRFAESSKALPKMLALDAGDLKGAAGKDFDNSGSRLGEVAVAGKIGSSYNGLNRKAGVDAKRNSDIPSLSFSPVSAAAVKTSARDWVLPSAIGVTAAIGLAALGFAPVWSGVALLAPLALMAGTLQDGRRGPVKKTAGRLPVETREAFVKEFRTGYAVGEEVPSDMLGLIGESLKLGKKEQAIAIMELMHFGHLASIGNGRYVYVDVSADAQAAQALTLINEGGAAKTAQALLMLKDQGNALQVDILRSNAAVKFLAEVLTPLESPQLAGILTQLGKTLYAVNSKTGEGLTVKHPLTAAQWAIVHQALDTVKDGFSGALRLVKVYAQNGGISGGRAVPVAAEEAAVSEAKAFPLIAKDDKAYTNLNKYGSNLTARAVRGMHPLIGRRVQIRQMVKTLLRVEKNNPVAIGEKGVGKTKLIEGLAQMIVGGEIPQLEGVNIIKLDVAAMVAGTKYRGEFEERLKGVIDEAKAARGKVLLFIDEIHTIIGLGAASGSTDASQLLKEAMSSGDLSLIGATTLDEYRKIEKDPALERRFNPILIPQATPPEAIEILEGVKYRYEKKHGVTISKKVVETAVRLAHRYIQARALPDSALDLIDDAGAEVELKATEAKKNGETPVYEVSEEDIAVEINIRTGIPAQDVNSDDLANLKELPAQLNARIIGQEEAVDAVAKAITRSRLGYAEEKQPIGSFIFLGPTGVGKTEFVRQLAKNQFGDEKNIVRIDMSEYQEKHSVSRLISAPPGYVGHESGGQLTEPVRRNPRTVVLFDEIEKAAPEVLDVLLQVIEDGRLTDGQGRTVDFSNTVIVMTSNIGGSLGVAQKRRQIGFIQDAETATLQVDEDNRRAGYLAALKAAVKPEFYNRVGARRVIAFNNLDRDDMKKILDLRIGDLNARLAHKKMSVELTAGVRTYLLDDATSAENKPYGARPLKQVIEQEVNDALVDAELAGRIGKGDQVRIDLVDGKLTVSRVGGAMSGMAGVMALPFAALAAPAAVGAAALVLGAGLYAWWKSRYFAGAPGPTQGRLSWSYRLRKKTLSAVMMFSVAFPWLHIPQVSAPRMSQADRQALIAYYRENKPKLVLMDWDNTFMDNRDGQNDKAGSHHYEVLRALQAEGIRVGFVTNRPFLGEGFGMEDLLMAGMPKDIAADFLLGVGGGAEIYQYGSQGERPVLPSKKMSYITDPDRETIKTAIYEVGAGLGLGESDFHDQNDKSYEYTYVLENQRMQIDALYEGLMARMKAAGIAEKYKFQLKRPVNADLQPYIRVRVLGAVKENGVNGILELLKEEGVTVAPEEMIYFGDEFNPGNDDVSAAHAQPRATAIAVGAVSDPRGRSTHLTPEVGPISTLAFLWDILGKKPRAHSE